MILTVEGICYRKFFAAIFWIDVESAAFLITSVIGTLNGSGGIVPFCVLIHGRPVEMLIDFT